VIQRQSNPPIPRHLWSRTNYIDGNAASDEKYFPFDAPYMK